MRGRWLVRFLSAVSSLVVSEAQGAFGSDPFCVSSTPGTGGQTHVSFLVGRSLFFTLWSEDARLASCEATTDPLVTESYRAVCDGSGTQGGNITERFDLGAVLAPGAPCALASSGAQKLTRRVRRGESAGKTRSKRAWIFPGTLWCGIGSRARRFDQLGRFQNTDSCCREHDHCKHFLPGFTSNFGVVNRNFFTISLCECDQRFRECLRGINNSISNMVGFSFFNVLKVPCLELQHGEGCTQTHQRGTCKAGSEAPYGIFKSPLPYNNTDVISSSWGGNSRGSEGRHVTQRPAIATQRATSEQNRGSEDAHGGGGRDSRLNKVNESQTFREVSTAAPAVQSTTPTLGTRGFQSSFTSSAESDGKPSSTRTEPTSDPTQRSRAGSQVSTNSFPPTRSTDKPWSPTKVAETARRGQEVTEQSRCCGFSTPAGADGPQTLCRSCLEQKTRPHLNSTPPPTSTRDQPTIEKLRRTTTMMPEWNTWRTTGPAAPTSATPKGAAQTRPLGNHTNPEVPGSTAAQTRPLGNHTNPEVPGSTAAQTRPLGNHTNPEVPGSTAAPKTERVPKARFALHKLTDGQLLCLRLNRLDECKYKIPPLETRYHLQNMASKTAYHCDCTSRLAVQIKTYKKPSILPALLVEYVSPFCFYLPEKKDCDRKSCSGSFTQASDLLQALKKMEGKDSGRMRKAGMRRRRRVPVRLTKRCLRLEREDDVMAQLTLNIV